MRQIILASQSPRRKELLQAMGLTFDTLPSNFEEYLDDSRPAEQVAIELGLGKALEVASLNPEAIVIGSDLIVSLGNRQLGKAEDEADAKQLLHDVTLVPNKLSCSIAVICLAENIQLTGCENAWVYFKPYDAEKTEAYLATGDWKDKAGAYGVQSGAADLIDHVSGNFDTIMGLATHELVPLLQEVGIGAKVVTPASPVPVTD